jgi:hypothetical protein
MEQRDYLMIQIEQLGKVLAAILSGFLGLKSKGQVSLGIEVTNERLQGELDIDMEKLLALNNMEVKAYLEKRKLRAEHIEGLSGYMKEIGMEETDKTKASIWLKKAIVLLDIADEISKTLSIDRVNKKKNMEKLLQE